MDEQAKDPALTDEQLKSQALQERLNLFVKEYGELVAKHKVDFACYPVFVPNGDGSFVTRVQNTPVDITNQPVKSPFIPEQK